MVSQTVDKIILAEKQAAEKVELAYQKSEQLISLAKEKAKEIINKANSDCKTEADCLMQNNEAKINEIFENNNRFSGEEVSAIRVKAQAKKGKAVDMVIAKIITKR